MVMSSINFNKKNNKNQFYLNLIKKEKIAMIDFKIAYSATDKDRIKKK